jgi:hypothetical protein
MKAGMEAQASGSATSGFDSVDASGGKSDTPTFFDDVTDDFQGGIADDPGADQNEEGGAEKEQSEQDPESEGNEDPSDGADETPEDKDQAQAKEDAKKDAKHGEKPTEKVKTFKVKSGGKDVEIQSDTPFRVKVDGKEEQVPLQDLLNNYSGKVSYEKKFSELDRAQKAHHAERQDLQSSIDRLFNLAVKENNPRGAIEWLAEAMGGDPRQAWKAVREEVGKQLLNIKDMSEEDLKSLDEKEELEYLRKKEQKSTASARADRQRQELDKRVTAVREKHNLDKATYLKIYDELRASGEVRDADLTPELVGEYHQEITQRQELGKMLHGLNPNLKNKDGIIRELRNVQIQNPEFTIEDLKEIAQDVYGVKKTTGLASKIKKTKPASPARPASRDQGKKEPTFFDDL